MSSQLTFEVPTRNDDGTPIKGPIEVKLVHDLEYGASTFRISVITIDGESAPVIVRFPR